MAIMTKRKRAERREKKQNTPSTWQTVAKEAQNHRDSTIAEIPASIPRLPETLPKNVIGVPAQMLADGETTIVRLSTLELVDQLRAGRLSASKVTMAYLKRAAVAQS